MTGNWPLLADGEFALIKVAVFLLIFAIAGIAKLVSAAQQRAQMARRQPPRPDPEVENEIEEFLRQAQGGQVPGQPAIRQPVRRVPVRQAAGRQTAAPVRAQVVDDPADTPVGAEVGQHVQKYMDTGEFARRGRQLGSDVAQADAQMEERVEQKFDHAVGKLAQRPGETATAPLAEEPLEPAATPLPGFFSMLSNPQGICQAVIASEIFQRPEGRWE